MATQPRQTSLLVTASYDRIAAGYDGAWTAHTRDLSLALVDAVGPRPGESCIDLTCGTGFLTGELARRTGTRAIGVDTSGGMLEVARGRHGADCTFVQADAPEYLRRRARQSADVITCAWGLGYTRPLAVVREAARVLRPGGRLGIVDNTLFSLAGVLWTSLQVFAERPEALAHVMQVRVLPHPCVPAAMMRTCGLGIRTMRQSARSYAVPTGRDAIERLTRTGAAAGFEFAADPAARDAVFARFAEILDSTARDGVRITHRWLMVVGEKP